MSWVRSPAVKPRNATMPVLEMAGAPTRLAYVVPPGGSTGLDGSPCSASVVMAPPKGFRKTPRSGVSIALAQSSFVGARKAVPKMLAPTAFRSQSFRPGRSGTRSFFSTSVSIVPVPPVLQLPSPPPQRKYPRSMLTPPTTAPPEMKASNTTSPASVMRAVDENFLKNPGPAGDGSPVSATIDVPPRKTPLRPAVSLAVYAASPATLIVGSPSVPNSWPSGERSFRHTMRLSGPGPGSNFTRHVRLANILAEPATCWPTASLTAGWRNLRRYAPMSGEGSPSTATFSSVAQMPRWAPNTRIEARSSSTRRFICMPPS